MVAENVLSAIPTSGRDKEVFDALQVDPGKNADSHNVIAAVFINDPTDLAHRLSNSVRILLMIQQVFIFRSQLEQPRSLFMTFLKQLQNILHISIFY